MPSALQFAPSLDRDLADTLFHAGTTTSNVTSSSREITDGIHTVRFMGRDRRLTPRAG